MASGYGRGGRGAALLQALNAPTRKPGQNGSDDPPTVPAAQPSVVGMGRGVVLPKTLGRGLPSHLLPQEEPPTEVAAPSAPRPGMGRGLAGIASLGRGAALQQALAGRGSTPATASPHPQQVQPPTIPSQQTPLASPSPSSTQTSPKPSGETAPPSDRKSFVTRISELTLEEKVISRQGESGRPISLNANYIHVKTRNEGVFQYAVSYSPEIDARNMRFKLLYEHGEVLGQTRAFDGAILFLPIKLPNTETILQSTRPTDDVQITLRIKLVKVVPHSCLTQLYNIVIRKVMQSLRLAQVGRHFYDPHRPAAVPQHRLEVWPGVITAVNEYEGGLMLMTDVSHRVLRTETTLDVMRDIISNCRGQNFKDQITRKVIGVTVLTRYNNKTYRIDDIAWDKSPASTFETSEGPVSFIDYYKKMYKKEITDRDQPLLIHRPKAKERRGQKALEMICLVPELSFMTGLSEDMKSDFRVMKDLATHTRVTPEARQRELRNFIESVNSHPEARAEFEKWGLELDSDTIQIKGRTLPIERIKLGNNRTESAGNRADWSRAATTSAVLNAVDIRHWMVVFTQRDRPKVTDFVQCIVHQCAQGLGIRMEMPIMTDLRDDRTDTYMRAVRDAINPELQLVVAVFPTSRDDRYNAFKKLCCVESPIPSQVINARTISRKDKLRSVCAKILLQLNCKLGGELWAVRIPMKKLMVVGIDVYHDSVKERRSIGGFVCSLNASCTRWFSRICHQMPGQELVNGLKICLSEGIKKYHEVNHFLPDTIIVFRDGVGDGQLTYVSQHETPQMAEVFPQFGDEYQPRFATIVVAKRINTRLLERKEQGRNVSIDNAPPGTVVDHTITRRNWYDFFLVSQHVGQGTVTPTHYIVVYDTAQMKVDHLQELTYKMTHMYYNWPGTVRVPAPCQYAHKLAYLVGQNIRKDPSPLLSDRLYFL